MMSVDNLVNWLFAYMLVGAVIWMLMYSAGLITAALGSASRVGVVIASIGSIVAWPVIVCVFLGGVIDGVRQRRARS